MSTVQLPDAAEEAWYWDLVAEAGEWARGNHGPYATADQVGTELELLLLRFDPDRIVRADVVFRVLATRAHSWRLWGAAYLIGGGCSDDGFRDFKGWLIARGEVAFRGALRDPDTLVEVVYPTENTRSERMWLAAGRAYELATEADLPWYVIPDVGTEDDRLDIDFDDQAEMSRRYPLLHAKLGRPSHRP